MPRFMPWRLWSQGKCLVRPPHLLKLDVPWKSIATTAARAALDSYASPRRSRKKERHAAMTNDVVTTNVEVADVLKKLSALVEHWQQTAERFRLQWEESEWYLGQTRATVGHLDEQLTAMRETYSWLESAYRDVLPQLQEVALQRDHANLTLAEARAAHAALRQQYHEMTEELTRAKDDVELMRRLAETIQEKLDAECARNEVLTNELDAVRRRAERRSKVRTHRPDLMAEIRAADGQLLFHGCPPNVSLSGLAFAMDRPIDGPLDFVKVTLDIPAVGRPIEAIGRLVWRRTIEASDHGGCELLEMSADGRKSLEEVLTNAA